MEETLKSTNKNTKYHQGGKIRWVLVFFSSILLFFGVCASARAATLYFSPSSGSYKVGQQFSVNVYVGSADQAMNAAEGTVSFSKDELSVVSLLKNGSIVNLWAQEPSFSNSAGSVDFSGIVLNPGYTGSAGKILTIAFKAKAEGETSLFLSSASVLANDGSGTNIFTGAGSAKFTITTTGAQEKVPSAPKVSSETHPDSSKWYSNDDPSFSWTLTKDITGVNVLADRNQNSNPGTKSDGMRTSYTFKDVDEGSWYFHIRLKNSSGWGATTHFGFNIDTETPTALDAYFTDTDQSSTRPTIKLSATDTTSGIDYYEIYANNASSTWRDDSTGQYQLNTLPAGQQKINITVYDKAGNSTSTELLRNVVLPVKEEAPKVVKYISIWDKLYAWMKLNILWIIIILLIILLIAILIHNTIYLRKIFATPKDVSKKKWSGYTSRRKIEALQKELEGHAEAIKTFSKKRKLQWKEKRLYGQYRKLNKRIKKYLDKISK